MMTRDCGMSLLDTPLPSTFVFCLGAGREKTDVSFNISKTADLT